MPIVIKPVSEENRDLVLQLKVADAQAHFIESVQACLQESQELALWRPVALYDEAQIIGFAMYGEFASEGPEGRVWLDRFLIDRHHQNKGYGKASLQALIDHLFRSYNCQDIYLSLYADNVKAWGLYQSFGFVLTGELDFNGELVMRLSRVQALEKLSPQ